MDFITDDSRYIIWLKYLDYLKTWIESHDDAAFYGQSPVQFFEWYDNRFKRN